MILLKFKKILYKVVVLLVLKGETLMDYKFGVYGDSIAFGYGNNGRSWFDIFTDKWVAIKLAQNGEKTTDVVKKIEKDNNHYQILILAVGINDLLQDDNVSANCDIKAIIENYEKILDVAIKKADKIIIQSVLPVREELFPEQNCLDKPQWAFNASIENFNIKLQNLAQERKVTFLNAYDKFTLIELTGVLIDAVHLNKKGNLVLAELYKNLARKS